MKKRIHNAVIPAHAGIQNSLKRLDDLSRFALSTNSGP